MDDSWTPEKIAYRAHVIASCPENEEFHIRRYFYDHEDHRIAAGYVERTGRTDGPMADALGAVNRSFDHRGKSRRGAEYAQNIRGEYDRLVNG